MTVEGEEADGEKSLLIIAVAPMPPQPGREICYAVLLMDLSADPAVPPELYSREKKARDRRPSRQAFGDVNPPARGYAFIPDLLKPLDDIWPCHGGGGDEVHLTPAREKLAWTSDAGKKTEEELSALFLEAMHSFQCVGFCLADDNVKDLPLVWVNDGMVTLSDYSRQQFVGYNCRFLQADATDPDTVRPKQGRGCNPHGPSLHPCAPSLQPHVSSLQPHVSNLQPYYSDLQPHGPEEAQPAASCTQPATPYLQVGQMKDAIVARRGVRVTLWNMTAKREGFWNCIAIYPSHDGRYFLSVQARRHAAYSLPCGHSPVAYRCRLYLPHTVAASCMQLHPPPHCR